VRDTVAFPGATLPLAVGRPRSLAALEQAGQGGLLVVATQRSAEIDEPGVEDLHPVACIVRVVRVLDARGDGKQIIVVGVVRTRFEAAASPGPALVVRVHPVLEPDEPAAERDAAWRRVVELAKSVIELRPDMPDEWKAFVEGLPSPGVLADLVASTLPLSTEERVQILSEPSVTRRLQTVMAHLEREVTIARAQQALRDESESDEGDPKRREKLLRRRLREIQSELGETDLGLGEVDELRERVEAAKLPDDAALQADRELKRLGALPQHAPERHMIRTYLEWLIELPWSVETHDRLDLAAAREILEADHHDLEKVKERILEYLAVRKLAPVKYVSIMCLACHPVVGN
jgi:ATP-dependent Lon protease